MDEPRPQVNLPWDPGDRLLVASSAVILVAFVTPWIVGWGPLPDRVPMHYDAGGTVDRWGGRGSVYLLVAVAALTSFALLALTRIPNHYNYPFGITEENAERQYRMARRLVLLMANAVPSIFLYIYLATWRVATGHQPGLSPLFIVLAVGSVFALVLWYLIAAHRAR